MDVFPSGRVVPAHFMENWRPFPDLVGPMKRTENPTQFGCGTLQLWHYGDGKLYVYPMNQRFKDCSTGTLELSRAETLLLIRWLTEQYDDGKPKRKGAKK